MGKTHSVVEGIYERLRDKVYFLLNNKKTKDLIYKQSRVVARSIANDIHDAPALWIKKASIAQVQQQLEKITQLKSKIPPPTLDHFRSRQRGGDKLVDLVLQCIIENRLPQKQEVTSIVRQYRQVSFITPSENQTLKKYMGKDKKLKRVYTHQEAYELAKITLIPINDDLFTRRGRRTKHWVKQMKDKYIPLIKQFTLKNK